MTTIYRRMDPRERGLLVALLLSVVALMLGPFPPAMNSALGAVVGVLAGFLTSRYYSRKASSELQAEADKLSLIMRALEGAGVAKFIPDEHGKAVGVEVRLQASVTSSSRASGSMQVDRGEDEQD
jgi:hypothetical protein